MEQVTAVIYTPDGDETQRRAWRDQCMRHCQARGYLVVGTTTQWRDAASMMLDGRAQVIVAAKPEHFPLDRVPRVEAAGQPPTTAYPSPRQRRPREAGQSDVGHHS